MGILLLICSRIILVVVPPISMAKGFFIYQVLWSRLSIFPVRVPILGYLALQCLRALVCGARVFILYTVRSQVSRRIVSFIRQGVLLGD